MLWSGKTRTAQIPGADGSVVFLQRDVEVPKRCPQLATNVVAEVPPCARDTPERERSVKQLVRRMVRNGACHTWMSCGATSVEVRESP